MVCMYINIYNIYIIIICVCSLLSYMSFFAIHLILYIGIMLGIKYDAIYYVIYDAHVHIYTTRMIFIYDSFIMCIHMYV